MRNETVAEGIKRRMAEKAADRRRRMDMAVQVAIWSSVAATAVVMAAVAATTWGR